eukprot:Plantae.Rhodophyta-Rhodochaete_pulchella.ctg30597.p1 GENE.Plantae.Rhodophyta-Rhodochaete_pulchella.ctg30597~~Plantae.Rhodophyta-Rhodochaete_pulchella.ctg30597.p1  ORF type:complete len:184 (+),score=29.02 Plantae.Rhodophyta-Rhodochaete_pulchella.ctg30597:189-740(+)
MSSADDFDWVRDHDIKAGPAVGTSSPEFSDPDDPASTPAATQDSETAKQKKPSTSRRRPLPNSLPLVVADKVDSALTLVQSDDLNLDLGGDVGAVGRVKVDRGSLQFDLKGTFYRATGVPSNTLCVATLSESEARVSACADHFIALTPCGTHFADLEQVVEGALSSDEDDAGNGARFGEGGVG